MAPYYNKITEQISEGGNIRSQRYFLDYVSNDDKVLNIGCGCVQFNVDLAKKCNDVTSIDIAPKMIEIAKASVEDNGIKHTNFICIDVMDYNKSFSQEYGVVFANFVLNTFRWYKCCEAIRHICSFVKPGGLLCIADEHMASKGKARFSQAFFRPIITLIHHIWAKHPFHPIYHYDNEVQGYGYKIIAKKIDESGFIASTIYKRDNENEVPLDEQSYPD
jgi:2-polyprenyl-3-methyl-5-hydroxy-6-metoxy-1,4-benzoquinol methylase